LIKLSSENVKKEAEMANLILRKPINEVVTLREAMDQLFDDAFMRPMGQGGLGGIPAIDMYQTKDNVIVKAGLPGLKPEDVQISITANVLSLSGEFKEESEQKEKAYHLREQRYGSFERSVPLPTDVQTEKASADFENGVLTITLPKSEAVKPKTINIKAKK
jgi:HSP20 family protein